jgi:TRAP-type C4-dicarboxylate transport system permease small subunit
MRAADAHGRTIMIEHDITGPLEGTPAVWRIAAAAMIAVAGLLALDSLPLLFPDGAPALAKWPFRGLMERDPLLADALPAVIRHAIYALGVVAALMLGDRFTLGLSRIAMWAPAVVVAIIFLEVVLRYVFSSPTLWANEMSLWIAGAIYLTAGLYALQQRSHIRIFVLYDMAPLWLRRLFDTLSVFCVCIFALAVVWGGYGEANAKFLRWETFGTAFDPPIPATVKPLILITLVLLAIQAVSNLVWDWSREPEVHTPADDVDIPPGEVLTGNPPKPHDDASA